MTKMGMEISPRLREKSVIIFCPCGRDRYAKVSLSYRIFSQDREGYIGKRKLGV